MVRIRFGARSWFGHSVVLLALTTGGSLVTAPPAIAQWYEDDAPFYERPSWRERRGGRYVLRADPDARRYDERPRRYRRWRDDFSDDEPTYGSGWRRYRDRYQDRFDEDPPPRASARDRRDLAEDGDDEQKPKSDEVRSGGPQPAIAPKAPPRVNVRTNFAPGSIVIDQSTRKLYFIISGTEAFRYPISVGREGFSWTGKEKISRIADWPDWHPPAEMREREPDLPVKMLGGINNPLGAKAIYLGTTLYRIHGTNNAKSIGQAASSGCFRMLNAHVIHLAEQVEVGAEVHVLKSLSKAVAAAE